MCALRKGAKICVSASTYARDVKRAIKDSSAPRCSAKPVNAAVPMPTACPQTPQSPLAAIKERMARFVCPREREVGSSVISQLIYWLRTDCRIRSIHDAVPCQGRRPRGIVSIQIGRVWTLRLLAFSASEDRIERRPVLRHRILSYLPVQRPTRALFRTENRRQINLPLHWCQRPQRL